MMILTYLLQVTLCLAFFYVFYLITLHKETLFSTNRIYLLSTLMIGFIVPLVRIYIQQFEIEPAVATVTYVGAYFDAMSYVPSGTLQAESIGLSGVLLFIYLAIGAMMFVRMVIDISRIIAIKRHAQMQEIDGMICAFSSKVVSPFSFMSTIYLPLNHTFSNSELAEICNHEKVHVTEKHTLDILFIELACIVLWPSPIVYFYRKKLKEVHEYLADANVLKSTPWEQYADFLVSQKPHGIQNKLANQLFSSQLKNRLTMMTQHPSSLVSRFKYLGVIPILFVVLLLVSFRSKSITPDTGDIIQDGDSTIQEMIGRMQEHIVGSRTTDTLAPVFVRALRLSKPTSEMELTNENKAAHDTYTLEMPIFPGCEDVPIAYRGECGTTNMSHFINTHLVYPQLLKQEGIEGKVVVKFAVGVDGFIKNIEVEHKLHPIADQAALDVFLQMNSRAGRWLPSRKDGVSMETELWVPIQFSNSGISAKKESLATNHVFTYVEEMPRFVGCEHLEQQDKLVCSSRALMGYLSDRVSYPAIDREKGIEGTVITQFTVNPDGTLSDIMILRSPSEAMKNEVLRIVNSMNDHPLKWIPGRHLNRPVPVRFTLPFKFALHDVVSQESKNTNVPSIASGKAPLSQDEDFKLYPNPVSTLLNVEIFDGAQTVNVLDMQGKLFLTKPLTQVDKGSVILNVSELMNGSYLVQVISASETTTMKFIVNH